MGVRARRKLSVVVPWVALVAVTALALWSLASRPSAPPTVDVEPLRAAAHRTEEAFADALVDLDEARAGHRAALAARERARSRADAAEAALATARARVEALEAEAEAQAQEVAIRQGRLEAAEARLAALEAELEAARDPVVRWLADAASPDARVRAAARDAARQATPEQLGRIQEELTRRPGIAHAVAVLVGGLPEGEERRALAVRVLVAPDAAGDALERVAAVGPEVLARPDVAAGVLTRAPDAVRAETLRWLSGRQLDWSAAQRGALADALLGDPDASAVAVRAVAALRLEGAGPRLVALTEDEDADVRAAAAYALSRVPDLEASRAPAARRLPALLDDADAGVRTAAALLAAALLGRPVDFDPQGGEAERRAARDRILDALP